MKGNANDHSAAPQAMGYLYQCRYALLESYTRLSKSDEKFNISIETLDDVSFEKGDYKEALQTKHHIKNKANLTDRSKDLWSTIRVWCDCLLNGSPLNNKYFLVTTSEAPEGSIAFFLRPHDQRNVDNAIELLNIIVENSKEEIEHNKKAYKAYQSLSEEQKKDIFERVFILDDAPSIEKIPDLLREKFYSVVKPKLMDSFLEILEGWWFGKIIKHLKDPSDLISSDDIELKIQEIQETFLVETFLKADDDIKRLKVKENDCKNYIFVKQLNLIRIDSERIAIAMSDFYRTSTQRTRWIADGRLMPETLDDFDKELETSWIIKFRRTKEDLSPLSSNEEKIKTAQNLYEWAEDGNIPQNHPIIKELFLARGSFHYLADELRIGWHVDFKKLIKQKKSTETI